MTRKVVLCLIAIVVAAASLSQAIGSVLQRRAAPLAAKTLPANGLAAAQAASDWAIASMTGDAKPLKDQLVSAAEKAALRGQRLEPLSDDAVAALGLVAADRGETEKARRLMQQAVQLNRRDRLANLWLVGYNGRANRVGQVLYHLDAVLRTSEAAEAQLFPILVQALVRSNDLTPFEQLLGTRPPWATDFWLAVVKDDAAVPNGARLRLSLAQHGLTDPAPVDAVLLNSLVKQRAYADALALRTALERPRAAAPGDLVAGGDFRTVPRLPPLDWETSSQGDYGADILPSEGKLVVSAIADSHGTVARQLIALPAGRYRLAGALEQALSNDASLSLQLNCAEGLSPGAAIVSLPLQGRRNEMTFAAEPGGCRYAWLTLAVAIPEGGEGADAVVERVSIVPQ